MFPIRSILACLAAGAVCGCIGLNDVTRLVDDARVVARVGVLAHPRVGLAGETGHLERALRFYRQSGVDAVVLTGELAKPGLKTRPEALDELWRKVFGGTSVRLIRTAGDFEVKGFEFAVAGAGARPSGRRPRLTFCCDRRLALTDGLCVYPLRSRTVCAGSFTGIDLQPGYEGGGAASAASQGLLASYYGDRTVVRRLDFTQSAPLDRDEAFMIAKKRLAYAEDVAAPWVFDATGLLVGEPEAAPQFREGAALQVLPGHAGQEAVLTVRWAQVLARFGSAVRAHSYEFTVAFAAAPDAPFLRRHVLSPGFCLAEDRDDGVLAHVLRASELPPSDGRRQLVVSVTPVGALGRRGRPLRSEPFASPNRGAED